MHDTENDDGQAGRGLRIYLASVAVVIVLAIAGIAYLYHTLDLVGRAAVRADASKTLVQLVAVGIIGGFIAWVLSEHSKEKERALAQLQTTREHEEWLNEFRRQAIDRLVRGTNVVRRAPFYIESHRSKKTYGEQMREIVDTYLDFGLLRHEIGSFPKALPVERVGDNIRIMQDYLLRLIDEWKSKYSTLPSEVEKQWPLIEAFEELKDLREADSKSRFRTSYLDAYSQALVLIRKSIFTPPPSGGDSLSR